MIQVTEIRVLHTAPPLVQKPISSEDNEPQVFEIVGDALRRLFLIWNRGYKTICVVAVDVHEALHIAVACKHIKRAQQYRRFDDITERAASGAEIEAIGVIDGLDRLLNQGRSGQLVKSEGGYKIGGTLCEEGNEPD